MKKYSIKYRDMHGQEHIATREASNTKDAIIGLNSIYVKIISVKEA